MHKEKTTKHTDMEVSDLPSGPPPPRHWDMLVLACLVIVAAFLLRVQDGGEQVALRGGVEVVVPPLCMAREWFGVCCPGCGLTRSFIYLAEGDWQASWRAHRLGWLLAAGVLLQIPYRLHGLCRPQCVLLPPWLRRWLGYGLIGLLFGNWLLGML